MIVSLSACPMCGGEDFLAHCSLWVPVIDGCAYPALVAGMEMVQSDTPLRCSACGFEDMAAAFEKPEDDEGEIED